jgi:hypothetical protein
MPIDVAMARKYKAGFVFIETGTECGHGCATALAAGFSKVFSCEIDRPTAEHAKTRIFYGIPEVKIMTMKSSDFLKSFFEGAKPRSADNKYFFWLDAHGSHETPILDELAALKGHLIEGDVVLVDDIRLLRAHNEWAKVVFEEHVLAALKDMGVKEISYEDDKWAKEDVLVAKF